jgi:protein involved in ribonucleotide reduction
MHDTDRVTATYPVRVQVQEIRVAKMYFHDVTFIADSYIAFVPSWSIGQVVEIIGYRFNAYSIT